jgi:tetratricopeptide (TPR) repeat protein
MTFLLALALTANPAIEAQYQSLDPTSIVEHLAFYELHKEMPEGQAALRDASRLLFGEESTHEFAWPENCSSFIELVSPQVASGKKEHPACRQAYALIEKAASKLCNRAKKGFHITSAREAEKLPPEEIDLSETLFCELLGDNPDARQQYRAQLDLMALVILSRLPPGADQEQKVDAICNLVFHEFGFRFPPYSTHEASLDRFTDLPSVLETRRGVCLGVATLILTLAERLGVNLDIYTPPGHIFLGTAARNIEPTWRGVHLDLEEYYTVNTKFIKKRTLRDVVGLVFMNSASVALSKSDWNRASTYYLKALRYMPDERIFLELNGMALVLDGKKSEALAYFEKALKIPEADVITPSSISEDILAGRVDKEGLQALLLPQDETRASKEKKKEALARALIKNPKFRDALTEYASCLIELGEPEEGQHALERLAILDPDNIIAHFMLSQLYHGRHDEPKARLHFLAAEAIAKSRDAHPKELKEFGAVLFPLQ